MWRIPWTETKIKHFFIVIRVSRYISKPTIFSFLVFWFGCGTKLLNTFISNFLSLWFSTCPWGNYLRQTTKQPEISRNLMEKIDFFRFSSNCPRRFLVMSKWFLSALRPSEQPPKLLDTCWDHLKKIFSNRIFDLQKPIFLRWLLYPLKMAFYGAVQNLKAFSIW